VLYVLPPGAAGWVDRFSGKARKGCDILVQALEREVGACSTAWQHDSSLADITVVLGVACAVAAHV
jgi:uncharacterized membrane protein